MFDNFMVDLAGLLIIFIPVNIFVGIVIMQVYERIVEICKEPRRSTVKESGERINVSVFQ